MQILKASNNFVYQFDIDSNKYIMLGELEKEFVINDRQIFRFSEQDFKFVAIEDLGIESIKKYLKNV
jgi:hypothetical protein